MALKGDLRDFSFVQMLNLINLAKKTGLLSVESQNRAVDLFFEHGKLIAMRLGKEFPTLLDVIIRSRLLPPSVSPILVDNYANFSDKETGIALINSGMMTQAQIINAVETFQKRIVRHIFSWPDGRFHFEPGSMPPPGVIRVNVDLQNLILVGSRNLQHGMNLGAELPSLEMALRLNAHPGRELHDLDLTAEEWRMISMINPHLTIRQLAQSAMLNEAQVRRVVFNLLQAGLVEIVRPVGRSIPGDARIIPMHNLPEKRSLVNRLINRIKSL